MPDTNLSSIARRCFADNSAIFKAGPKDKLFISVEKVVPEIKELKEIARQDMNKESIVKGLENKLKSIRTDINGGLLHMFAVLYQDAILDCLLEAISEAEARELDVENPEVQKIILAETEKKIANLNEGGNSALPLVSAIIKNYKKQKQQGLGLRQFPRK